LHEREEEKSPSTLAYKKKKGDALLLGASPYFDGTSQERYLRDEV
jgi:hypothetical protein